MLKINWNARRQLSLILWLVALHSLCAGVCLISFPAHIIQMFGFSLYQERFFPVQGGMFHIVISMVYALCALRVERFGGVIILSVIIKFIAFFFLLCYYLFVQDIWFVLLAGIMDGFMGAVILWSFLLYKRNEK